MRGLLSAIMLGAAAVSPSFAHEPTPPALPAGPSRGDVELMVLTEVNTRISAPGSDVRLRLNKPLTIDGTTVLPVGTPAFGKVEALKKSAITGSRGTISVKMTHIEGPNGPVPLAGDVLEYQARGGKNDDAVKALLAPMYVLFSPANSAKLKAGDIVLARLAPASPDGPIGAESTSPR